MNIKTKEFSLSKKDFFVIITLGYLKSRWWLIILLLLLWLYKNAIFIGLLTFFYIFWIILYCWVYANSKKNKIFFQKSYYEIDKDFITGYLEDGGIDKLKLSNIIKIVKTSKYFLLYISKTQFIYLPLNVFTCQEDINNFNSFLPKN